MLILNYSFVDYGVMLEIQDLQYLPDGRSFVDCIGGRRFKVKVLLLLVLFFLLKLGEEIKN